MDFLGTIFDKLDMIFGKQVTENESALEKKAEIKNVKFTFEKLPDNYGEIKALSEASLDTPFKTAAITLLMLLTEGKKEDFHEIFQFLSGPRAVLESESQMVYDTAKNMKKAVSSCFEGAVCENGFTPSLPLTVTFFENEKSYSREGFAKLYVSSSGAEEPRKIILRKSEDGKWYLWNQHLLEEITEKVKVKVIEKSGEEPKEEPAENADPKPEVTETEE